MKFSRFSGVDKYTMGTKQSDRLLEVSILLNWIGENWCERHLVEEVHTTFPNNKF